MRDDLPVEIFRVIQQYLYDSNYRRLLNTNSAIFQHIKYETVYYNLRIDWKEIKTIKERSEIIDLLARLYGSVKDKSKQISLRLSGFGKECTSFLSGIHQLVHIYDILGENPIHISYSNLYFLHIAHLINIDRLSGLSGIKILFLSNCNRIKVIDFIPELKSLRVNTLPELLDLSNYGNIPELFIENCSKLNFHGLGNHERLYLAVSHNELEIDLSLFRNVQYLTVLPDNELTVFKGLDKVYSPSFAKLTHLRLHCNNQSLNISSFPVLCHVKLFQAKISLKVLFPSTLQVGEFRSCVLDDLSVLSTVKELTFVGCKGKGFNNVESLSNAYKLVFSYIEDLKNVNSLDRVYHLTLVHCDKVKDISKLGKVHRLCVDHCGIRSVNGLGEGNVEIKLSALQKIVDFSPLRFIQRVTIRNCGLLVDGRGLSDVKILTIVGCFNFIDTSSLGKVQKLSFVSCSRIVGLIGLEDVPWIHLEDCKKLEDIDCLGKQQYLLIKDCPKLKQLMKKDVSGKYARLFEGIRYVSIDPKTLSWKMANSVIELETDFLFEKEY